MNNSFQLNILSIDPYIISIPKLATNEECTQLIKLAKSKLKPALVSGKNGSIASEGRTAQNSWFVYNSDELISEIIERISFAAEQTLERAEAFQIAKYMPGGEYRPHFDAYDMNSEKGQLFTQKRGQRLYTALLYLNNVNCGGETFFPKIKIDIKPECGTMLFFENCLKNSTEIHPQSLHGSRPVVNCEKWIGNLWFRERV